jgi:N-acetylglucosamine-6-phosphate deacetylase
MSGNERNEPLLIRADRVITPDGTIEPGAILFSGHRIEAVAHHIEPPPGADVIDLPGLTLVPGFIDLHVHGGQPPLPPPREIRSYARWAPSRGVTAFLATIVSRTPADAMSAIRAATESPGARRWAVLGLNLEGPFVSPDRRGALPASWVTAPDTGVFRRLLESCDPCLRLMTVAPEIPGALDLIKDAVAAGVTVSLGHTDAGYDSALPGFRAGASHVTHAFNAMRPSTTATPASSAPPSSPGVTIEVIATAFTFIPRPFGCW